MDGAKMFMKYKVDRFKKRTLSLYSVIALGLSACTAQLPDSFRFFQQDETFSSIQSFNSKVDILFVVDNSASMDSAQDKLRTGMTSLADELINTELDIQVSVISTDAFMANSAFTTYLATTVPSSAGYTDTHVSAKVTAGTFTNPAWSPTLVNLVTGAFDSGFTYFDVSPNQGSDAAKLKSGIADGPRTGFCGTFNRIFIGGNTDCAVRDNSAETDASACINPSGAQSSISQCVNTVQNDTVRTGKPVISTVPSGGASKDAAFIQQFKDDFKVNITTGTAGQGSERGLASVLQLLADNETDGTTDNAFRADSLRVIVFATDEDDSSFTYPTGTPPAGYNPFSHVACDEAALVAANPTHNINGSNGYCCSNPANNCRYGSLGTSCPAKTVDGHTYTLSLCPVTADLMAVSDIKDQIDQFFLNLDGTGATDPNYMTAVITPLTAATIQSLQSDRDTIDTNLNLRVTVAVDRGDRYLAFKDLVGNGSTELDIGTADYSTFLGNLATTIIEKKGTFALNFAPSNKSEMIITIVHANGSETVVQHSEYEIVGNLIQFSVPLISQLSGDDQVNINYQPGTNEQS